MLGVPSNLILTIHCLISTSTVKTYSSSGPDETEIDRRNARDCHQLQASRGAMTEEIACRVRSVRIQHERSGGVLPRDRRPHIKVQSFLSDKPVRQKSAYPTCTQAWRVNHEQRDRDIRREVGTHLQGNLGLPAAITLESSDRSRRVLRKVQDQFRRSDTVWHLQLARFTKLRRELSTPTFRLGTASLFCWKTTAPPGACRNGTDTCPIGPKCNISFDDGPELAQTSAYVRTISPG